MESRELTESTSQVFLTEARTSTCAPVRATQHHPDSNSHFAESLHKQQKTVTATKFSGVNLPSRRSQRMSLTDRKGLLFPDYSGNIRTKSEEKDLFKFENHQKEDLKEEYLEDLKSRQIRTWRKMTARISFSEPSADYYNQTPIKPGIWFWKSLLLPKTSTRPLTVRIPDMLAVFDEVRWAFFDSSKGEVNIKSEFGIGSFYKSFEKFRDGMNPCAVLRIPGQTVTEMKAVLLNWLDFGEKVMKNQLPGTCLIQRLVKCHGSRPTIVRLFFIAQSRANKATYAYSINNTDIAMSKYPNGKSLVCSDYYDGIEITPQFGSALTCVREAGERVVEYLQACYYIRLEEIVLDFVRDEDNQVWLLSCKGFKIDMAVQRIRELKLSQEEGKSTAEIREMHMEKLDEQLSAIHCKLCLLPYKPFEMQHSLPFKVLLLYKQHTYRSERKLLDLSHLRVNTVDFLSHCVSVCEICYMLLVHEYELIETEMKLAALMNVPVKHPQVMGAFEYDHPNFMPARMHQWRLMFYFQSIESEHPPIRRSPIYLQYSFLGSSYLLKMTPRWEDSGKLNVSRLYYFFALRDVNVVHFCKNTLIQFRITRTKKWSDVIACGECRPLSLFSSLLPTSSSLVQAFDILFFLEDAVICKVCLRLGFACDKQINVKALPVTISRFSTVYVPEPSFFTSDSLPDSWMEAFQDDYKEINESMILDSSEEMDEMYTPVLGKRYLQSPMAISHTQSVQSLPSIAVAIPSLPIPPLFKSSEESTKRKRETESTATSSRVLYYTESVTRLRSPALISSRRSVRLSSASETKKVDNFEDSAKGEIADDLIEMVTNYVEKRKKRTKSAQKILSTPCEEQQPTARPFETKLQRKKTGSRRSRTALSPFISLHPERFCRSSKMNRLL